jgi:hypothetical protein
MPTKRKASSITRDFEDFKLQLHPTSGTEDDDDDRDDERYGENEAAIREIDENTESREEFEVDDEDALSDIEKDDDSDRKYDKE